MTKLELAEQVRRCRTNALALEAAEDALELNSRPLVELAKARWQAEKGAKSCGWDVSLEYAAEGAIGDDTRLTFKFEDYHCGDRDSYTWTLAELQEDPVRVRAQVLDKRIKERREELVARQRQIEKELEAIG